MKGNFTRINNMESEYESIQLSRICIEYGSNFFPLSRFLKKRSGNDFISTTYMSSHPNTTQKCRKTHSYVIFHSDLFLKAQCLRFHQTRNS